MGVANSQADKTNLLWKLLPDKSLVFLLEKTASKLKVSKYRLTFFGLCKFEG